MISRSVFDNGSFGISLRDESFAMAPRPPAHDTHAPTHAPTPTHIHARKHANTQTLTHSPLPPRRAYCSFDDVLVDILAKDKLAYFLLLDGRDRHAWSKLLLERMKEKMETVGHRWVEGITGQGLRGRVAW